MNVNRTGIQAEQSVIGIQSEKPAPPWRPPHCPPLVCEPHRGTWMKWMGVACLLIGLISTTPLPVGILGIPLCLATGRMARCDLKKMKEERMDRGGEAATVEADIISGFGLWFSLFNIVVVSMYYTNGFFLILVWRLIRF